MKKIKIFLASSAELKSDRDALRSYIAEQNDRLSDRGLYVHLVRWEERVDSVTIGRTQDSYNQEIRECDYLICMFQSKAGDFTVEEFEVGLNSFQDQGKPIVYALFKDADVKISSLKESDIASLFKFQDRLKVMGHYLQWYKDEGELKLKARKILDQFS